MALLGSSANVSASASLSRYSSSCDLLRSCASSDASCSTESLPYLHRLSHSYSESTTATSRRNAGCTTLRKLNFTSYGSLFSTKRNALTFVCPYYDIDTASGSCFRLFAAPHSKSPLPNEGGTRGGPAEARAEHSHGGGGGVGGVSGGEATSHGRRRVEQSLEPPSPSGSRKNIHQRRIDDNVVPHAARVDDIYFSQQEGSDSQAKLSLEQKAKQFYKSVDGRVVVSVGAMVGVERAMAALLKLTGGPISSPVALLAIIGSLMALNNSVSNDVFAFMEPAVKFFDQWMPLFFVPSVASITIAPLPSGLILLKSAVLLGSSYLFVLWASAFMAKKVKAALDRYGPEVGLKRGRWGLVEGDGMTHEERLKRIGEAATAFTKKVAQKGARALASAALKTSEKDVQKVVVTAASAFEKVADSIHAHEAASRKAPSVLENDSLLFAASAALILPALSLSASTATPALMAPGLLLLSIALFKAAKEMPAGVRKWLSPTVAGGLGMAAVLSAYGAVFLSSWHSGIRVYQGGAGALLAMLIGPAVAALGFKVHTQREMLQQSAVDLAVTCAILVPLQFLVGAILGRLLSVPPLLTVSLLPAHTTLGIALEMGPLLGANAGIITAGVTIAGTTGISTAQPLLDKWKVKDPVTRGMAVGVASHSLGTSALVASEPKAAAVAGLTFALKGALSALLISIPAFRTLLLTIASGGAV